MKTTRISLVGFIVAVVLGLGIGGCANDPGSDLLSTPRPIVPDVPLPTGFKLEDVRSRSWSDGGLRFVDHLYEGKSDKMAVIRFYENQMPISRWTPLVKQITQGRATLDYEKEDERCRITVYDAGVLGGTYLQVAIWPSRSGSAPTPKEKR